MANWYAALFSRAPSKVCRAKCQPWSHWLPPSHLRQLKILCICIWEQTTFVFDESWGHGKSPCNSSHCSKKSVGWEWKHAQSVYVSVSGFLRIKMWLCPSALTRFRCFWQFSTRLPRLCRAHRGWTQRKGRQLEWRVNCVCSINF